MRAPFCSFIVAAALVVCAAVAVDTVVAKEPATSAWSFDQLDQRARELAKVPYRGSTQLPPALSDLTYDTYRLIAFEHEKAIWKADQRPFWLECFHRGYLFRDQVDLHLVEDGAARELTFDRKLFQYRGEIENLEVPDDIGFAGFRVIGKFESSPHPLEIAALLGGSYFRAIGEGQVYGSSARGLAIDIGLPKAEEFPVFRAFWIERPKDGAKALRLWALLDSPSVCGAYQMTMRPGEATQFDIRARLHFRRTPEKVGLAPITSMWMWGDGRAAPEGDRRPKVHDSDGLLVRTADEQWIWRPLTQQAYPSLTHYDLKGIRGFGLLQRDTKPAHFLDDEAKYHLRPSVWIEPKRGWDQGAVELLELPADHEGIDNIAAWWVPRRKIEVSRPLDVEYRVSFLSGDPPEQPAALGRAVETRVQRDSDKPTRIEVLFRSRELAQLDADARPHVELKVQRGKVGEPSCLKQTSGDWLLSFDLTPESDAPVELIAALSQNKTPLTETWRYLCPKQ